jgi:hypothetical protein
VPNDKELRAWVIGIIVAGWLLVAWILADEFLWPHPDPIGEMLGQPTRPPQIQTYIVMAGIVAGVGLMTRAMVFVLRSLREAPRAHTRGRKGRTATLRGGVHMSWERTLCWALPQAHLVPTREPDRLAPSAHTRSRHRDLPGRASGPGA